MFFPYLTENSKLVSFLNLICVKNVPKKVTSRYILSLGFSSSNDRLLLPLLKFLGLLDSKGVPTQLYEEIHVNRTYGATLAKCVFASYKDLYQKSSIAHTLSEVELLVIFKQESTQSDLTKAVKTFKYIGEISDFSKTPETKPQVRSTQNSEQKSKVVNLNLNINLSASDDYDKLLHLLDNILN